MPDIGLLLDVGSGSVGVAIVERTPDADVPTVIWSTRSHARLTQISSISETGESLVTLLSELEAPIADAGMAALREYTGQSRPRITTVQATIAAPWSYSISRTIAYEQSKQFEITHSLVHDLAVSASEQAMRDFNEAYGNILPDLRETSRSVLKVSAHEYQLPVINRQATDQMTLSHVTTLVYGMMYDAVEHLAKQVASRAELAVTSSIVSYYFVQHESELHVRDMCLVDVTDEATEIGIVRDGALTYATHTPFGTIAIAREIAAANDRPLSEIHSRLNDILTQRHSKSIDAIMQGYQEKVSDVFKETGDVLSIPRNVYVLVDAAMTESFLPMISSAAQAASHSLSVTVHDIAAERMKESTTDPALWQAALFFHTADERGHFAYL